MMDVNAKTNERTQQAEMYFLIAVAGYRMTYHKYHENITANCRSQWPRGLRLEFAAARLLGSWVRIPTGAYMAVSC
jgi:hypothetical protein